MKIKIIKDNIYIFNKYFDFIYSLLFLFLLNIIND